jgi:hypothetical protein
MCLFQGRQCVLRFRAAKASACLRADDGDTCGRRSPLEASFLCLLLSPHQLIFLGHLVRLVVLSPRSIQSLMCRHFVIIGFGGGAAGRFFMVCRQLVDPCFHLSLSTSRMGRWVSPPLVPQDVGTSRLASVLWCPPSSASSVAGCAGHGGVGMRVSSFPLSVVVVALSRVPCRSFSSSPSGVVGCLSIV